MNVYTVTLYNDEPEEAAAHTSGLASWFRTLGAARKAAKAALTDYWNSASVHRGTLVPAVFGISPERIEDSEALRYIGPTWDEPA